MEQNTNLTNKLRNNPKLYNKKGHINSNLAKMLTDADKEFIHKLYPHQSLSQAVYCLLNNISVPQCDECGKLVKYFNPELKRFSAHCSLQCSRKGIESKEKRAASKLEKYGEPAFNNRARCEATCMERFGVINPNLLNSQKEKISLTLKKNYSDRKEEILAKKEKTFQDRYGDHPNRSDAAKTEKRKSNLEKYGVEHTTQLSSTKRKIKESFKNRYGVDSYSKTEEFKTRIHKHNSVKSKRIKEDFLQLVSQIDTGGMTRAELANRLKLPVSSVTAKISKFNIPIQDAEFGGISQCEIDVGKFIESLNVNFEKNNRSVLDGKELDIYLPDNNLAIELNGIYWHTEKFGKGKNYHLSKTEQCEAHGIQLLHIWDIEWTDPVKREIWKSMIKSRLGRNQKIHARKCELKEVSTADAKKFCQENHLEGYVGGVFKKGLYHNNILVQLVVIGKTRFNKNFKYELIRAASLKGYTVVGGLSKLLHKSEDIISYANRRYSRGDGYKSIGMTIQDPSPPNYFYNTNGCLSSRLQYQKHKLLKILKVFDSAQTEVYNMQMNDYYRIWDCGHLVFVRRAHSKHSDPMGTFRAAGMIGEQIDQPPGGKSQ
jgi:hypothetical protein